MHSLHSYRAAVGSYRRWYIVLVLLFFAGWLASLTVSLVMTDVQKSVQVASGSVPLTYPPFLFYSWFLGFLAVILVAHLKEMLGSATSLITPGLVRSHFLVAGVIAVVFTVVVPVANCWVWGFFGSAPAVVGMALVTLALVALATFRWSWTVFFVCYWPAACMYIDRLAGRHAIWIPSTASSVASFALAVGCLAILALRLAKLHEEMPEYARRLPTSWHALMHPTAKATGAGGISFAPPMPPNLRTLGRCRNVGSETLLQRALHWHAAWRIIWSAAAMGTIFGASIFGLGWFIYGWDAYSRLLSSPMTQLFSVFPIMIILHPRNRGPMVQEWMHPWSRTEYVRAVGVTLAASCATCWLVIHIVPGLILWIATSEKSPLDSTQQSQFYETLRHLQFSVCAMPLMFGAATWPQKSVVWMCGTAMGYTAFLTLAMLTYRKWIEISPFYFHILLAGILAAGFWLVWTSYRRWLEFELDG